jgi:hypothetical protein
LNSERSEFEKPRIAGLFFFGPYAESEEFSCDVNHFTARCEMCVISLSHIVKQTVKPMKRLAFSLALILTVAFQALMADSFAGQYHAISDYGIALLQLEGDGQGRYQGSLTIDDYPAAIVAEARGDSLVGELHEGYGEIYRFTARLTDGGLELNFESGESLLLASGPITDAELSPAWDDDYEYGPGQNAESPSAPGELTINGRAISQQQAQTLAAYGIQAQPGNYWYDPVCGAWGIWGGPTAGFVQAGIPVPPLPAHASNGQTGVYVNGRNIAYSELQYLQTLAQGPIYPGQYWLDANGYAGAVGGPALINFLQAAQSSGSVNSWYGNGSSGWSSSDGSGGVWIANPYGGTGTSVTY